MAMRKSAPLWAIIYAVLAVAIILVFLQIVGVFGLTPMLANIIYLLAIFAAIVTVLHWVRLI